MFLGIRIPKFSGRRKKRITDLLKEAEKLSSNELEREEILARLFKYFSLFLQRSKEDKIREEIKKAWEAKDKEEVIIPYLNRLLRILTSIRSILNNMGELNKKILGNVEELNTLVQEHNKSRLRFIRSLDEKKFFLEFQELCNKRYGERQAIENLLNSTRASIELMIKTIEMKLKGVDKIDDKDIMELFNSQKQLFLAITKEGLKELGFEVKSLDDVENLEELNQVIFNRNFLNMVKHGSKITRWNKRIRRIFLTYVAVFYIGFQIVVPATYATQDFGHIVKNIHHPEIVQQLQQEMSEINFKSYDNIELTGILVKNKENVQTDKVMLFVHGANSNATGSLKYIDEIRRYTTNIDFLTINLRGHDQDSRGFFRGSTLGVKEAFDIVGAINTLDEMGYEKVVVYGHSIGGAAVINALGKHNNLLSKEIEVEGAIFEKTYSHLDKFIEENHETLFSNLGISMAAPFVGAKEHFPKVLPVTGNQTKLTIKLIEKIGGFKVTNNDPAETIKKINVPVIVIGVEGGDVFTTENDANILAHNAKHSKLIIAKNGNRSLADRHSPESNNPQVVDSMINFANILLK